MIQRGRDSLLRRRRHRGYLPWHDSKAARKIPKDLWVVVRRKLDMVNAATNVQSLRLPPGNRLEALQDDRAGSLSIRVNDQYRITFRFDGEHAFDVLCEDYH